MNLSLNIHFNIVLLIINYYLIKENLTSKIFIMKELQTIEEINEIIDNCYSEILNNSEINQDYYFNNVDNLSYIMKQINIRVKKKKSKKFFFMKKY